MSNLKFFRANSLPNNLTNQHDIVILINVRDPTVKRYITAIVLEELNPIDI